ncbi:MAG TPA: hypothetical protein VF484_05170 [Candidatus Limnocylindrales bacterium]
MASGAVPGFLPSRNGFHFVNAWPSVPAFWVGFGLLRLGIGDAGRGFCGGMAFAVRDRFERGELPPPDTMSPPAGTPFFAEIARRQLDSFDHLVVVPWRFWWTAIEPAGLRDRASAATAWPAIRADIDAGRLAMVGLVRTTGLDPLRRELGHQVGAYRYEERPERVTIGIYDPNHPDDDTVELVMATGPGGSLGLSQTTGEPLAGLLHLPYAAPLTAG